MRLLPSVFYCLLSAGSALAAPMTLVSETFDPGQPTRLGYFGFSGSVPSITDDGKLAIGYVANGRFATGNFARAVLGVGDSLSVKFELSGNRVTSGPTDFLIGFYDSLGTPATDNTQASRDAAAGDKGYVVTLRDDPGNRFSGTTRSDFTGETLAGEAGGFNGTYAFGDGNAHAVELVYTINRSTSASIDIYYDGVRESRTNHSGVVTGFDNLQFGFGDDRLDGLRLDNLSVTVTPVPEPSAAACGAGLAGMAWGRRRRRR